MKVEVIKGNLKVENKVISADKKLKVAAYCRVSTDTKDQLNSYNSQVLNYTELIQSNKNYEFAGIYADPGISGTQTLKREEFNRMIADAKEGKIDLIITKSISRFARNTLDTLKYVRMLKEKNVAIKFEEENINTLTMEGELLLTVLSSVAQQEVENISQNVKKGLKMKMQRGELVGFNKCLGYHYDYQTKVLSINEEEAKIIRYIFNRYLLGLGCDLIAKELTEKGIKTVNNGDTWSSSTIGGIIKNEKYKGDVILGKTYTLNPITKRRMKNKGEEDSYFIKDHHEPIIDRETWDRCNEIMKKRRRPGREASDENGIIVRKYAFSGVCSCGFCGGRIVRKTRYSGTKYQTYVWKCEKNLKKGIDTCPDCIAIDESVLEEAFQKCFNTVANVNSINVESFARDCLCKTRIIDNTREIKRLESECSDLIREKGNLMSNKMKEIISEDDFNAKYIEYQKNIFKVQEEINKLKDEQKQSNESINRINKFLDSIKAQEAVDKFNRDVFQSVIEKVIIGSVDEEGNKNPYLITYKFIGDIEVKEDVKTYPQFARRIVMLERKNEHREKRLSKMEKLSNMLKNRMW